MLTAAKQKPAPTSAAALAAAPVLKLQAAPGRQSVAKAAAAANDARLPDLVDRVIELLTKRHPALGGDPALLSDIEKDLRLHFGGDEHYVRSRRAPQSLAESVLSMFNGQNPREVARELKISRATVYRIIKQPAKK